MQEPIDRQALIADYRICGGCSNFENCNGYVTMCDSARVRQAINEAPKVKAQPERCGRWVVNDRNPDYADCTNCGLSEWLGANGSRAYAQTLLPGFKKFCPNCGARMGATLISEKPRTNADRIRQMSVEELANILCFADCEVSCPEKDNEHCNGDCCGHFLEWLRQEVNEEL